MRTVILSGIVDPEEVKRARRQFQKLQWKRRNPEKSAALMKIDNERRKEAKKAWRKKNSERLKVYERLRSAKRRYVPQKKMNWLALCIS